MSAHRVLRDLFRAFESVGPGIGRDPGDAGTITPTHWGQQFLITTAGVETRTLARPNNAGITTSIVLDTDGGDLTLTVTGGYNAAGDTTIVFGDAGDMVTFMSVKTGATYQWALVSNEGTTVVDAPVLPAEHGVGAVGTSSFGAPKTRRWTENGVIVTQITFDITGLTCSATANDVIGLPTGVAFIGRNVVATNGVIFKTEFSCLETPVGADAQIDVVRNALGTIEEDTTGGTNYISNSGVLVIGQTIQNLLPGIPANEYYYLNAGAGSAAGTYTAGMFVLTTYGHAVLA